MASEENGLVLGLDPGSRCTGYGLVLEKSGVLELLETGIIQPDLAKGLCERLGYIFTRLREIIAIYKPQEAAVEDVFVAHNASSALKLGQASGAVLVACSNQNLRVSTYEPTFIKKTLVGAGRAEKSQVAFMVGRFLGMSPNWPRDSSDALAAAICHLNLRKSELWQKNGES